MQYIACIVMTKTRKLKTLVGTMTNTADCVAQAVEMGGADLVTVIDVQMVAGWDIGVFDEDALYVTSTCTYGAGDVPDNAKALYESLAQTLRFLGPVRYGVMALGDSAYPQPFCNGGQRFDERLTDLGAKRVGDVLRLDASAGSEPETEGIAWCRQ